jgi:hypothetical protein
MSRGTEAEHLPYKIQVFFVCLYRVYEPLACKTLPFLMDGCQAWYFFFFFIKS